MNELHSLAVTCPWCFESVDIHVEDDAEPGEWVEDCSVCCHPLALTLELDMSGSWALNVDRSH